LIVAKASCIEDEGRVDRLATRRVPRGHLDREPAHTAAGRPAVPARVDRRVSFELQLGELLRACRHCAEERRARSGEGDMGGVKHRTRRRVC